MTNKIKFEWHKNGRGYFIDVIVNGEKVWEAEFHPLDVDGTRSTMMDVIEDWQEMMEQKYNAVH